MKVLGIVGSPHGKEGNTYLMIEKILEEADGAGAETEIVILSQVKINFCLACYNCFRTGQCSQEDDVKLIHEKMFQAEGIVLGSPCHWISVSGQMKAFIDRCTSFGHKPILQGKYGIAVSPTGAHGEEEVAEYMVRVMRLWGIVVIGKLCAIASFPGVFHDSEKVFQQASRLGRDIVQAINEKRSYPQSGEVLIIHKLWKNLAYEHRDFFRLDYEFWRKKLESL